MYLGCEYIIAWLQTQVLVSCPLALLKKSPIQDHPLEECKDG